MARPPHPSRTPTTTRPDRRPRNRPDDDTPCAARDAIREGIDTSAGPVRGATPRHGTLTVLTGPMYSGKSSGLVDRVERVARASRCALVVRPASDTRTAALLTHAGRAVHATLARHVTEARAPLTPAGHRSAGPGVVWPRLPGAVRLVAVDEVQFLPAEATVAFVRDTLSRGVDVVVAGLDLDSRGVPFDTTAALLALADVVEKRAAVCVRCGADARRSHRLTADHARVSVGGAGAYEARCVECWEPDAGEDG